LYVDIRKTWTNTFLVSFFFFFGHFKIKPMQLSTEKKRLYNRCFKYSTHLSNKAWTGQHFDTFNGAFGENLKSFHFKARQITGLIVGKAKV
jgi:hypothetical protein